VNRPRIPFLSLAPSSPGAAAGGAGNGEQDVRDAIDRVISRGWFVLGPEVDAFESEFASAMGASHAVGVGSGTDAIALILRALNIGPGDEVITSPLSAAFTALAVMMAGARPVFADVDPSRLTIDPEEAARAITPLTRAILPVHLYGQPADMSAIERLAARHNLAVVEDCCQAHLATAGGRPVGSIGIAGAFSFYPTKNLGAMGDGGAVVTNDRPLADRIRRLRNGGQRDRYRHDEFGVNSRLDEMQAASPRLDGAAAGDRRGVSIGPGGRPGGSSARARRRARVPFVRGPRPRARGAAIASHVQGHRNVRPLSRSHPTPAGHGRRECSRLSRGGAGLRRSAVAAAPSGPDR